MRLICLLPCLMIACGDNSAAPDARVGPKHDGHVDSADVDAPNPGTPARIWVVGDFLTDGRRQAGAFTADAALPFNTATPPAIVVPNGVADQLFAGAGSTANELDARGSKIAYVADQTVAARFDLNVADADGSNPIVVVQGGALNVEITSVALSPDGTKVAFTMDSTLINGGFDLFVAPTTAAATPVKISPDRPLTAVAPANLDVFPEYEWSADSKFVAFSGDLTDDNFDQGYVTDTTASPPTTVEVLTRADIAAQAGTQGIRSKLLFDNNNNVYFRARVTAANGAQFTFFKSDTSGIKAPIATPARGDASPADIGAFGITPDGTTLVFSADSPTLGTYNLFAQDIANPQTPTNLTNLTDIAGATLRADFNTPLFFSPDSHKVAVIANYLSGADNALEPFVINLDGSGMKRLVAITAASNKDTDVLVWGDNATLFAGGDLETNNVTATFKLDVQMTDQVPTPAIVVPTGGDIVNVFAVPQ